MQLRDYQAQAINQLHEAFRGGHRAPILLMPCGAGKTLTAAWMCQSAASKGNETLFLVHRRELMKQTIDTFRDIGINTDGNIKVDMVLNVGNHLDQYNPRFIIADECNFALAKSWRRVFDAYHQAQIVGLSATPVRLSGEPMGDVFDEIVEVITSSELIGRGCLSDYDYYAPSLDIDLSNVRRRAGDYATDDLEERLNRPAIYGDVIKEFHKLAHSKKTIVYCATVRHSKATAEAFRQAGYRVAHFDGKTPTNERDAIVEAFKNGDIQVLCNCDLVSFGFDVPDCDCCVLLRPTQSLPIFIQQSMRCLRYKQDKRAVILDFVGNYQRHGMPTQDRAWSLEGRVKKHREFDDEGKLLTRVCAKCFGTFPAGRDVCPYCGAVYETSERELRQIKEAELVKIEIERKEREEKEKKSARIEIGMCRSYEELLRIERERGYKSGWAWIIAKKKGIIA